MASRVLLGCQAEAQTHRRMRRGGAAAPPNSGKQRVKFGQTVGEIRAKQEEKIGQRKLQINPFGMWMMTSHRQCPRGVCL